MSGQVEKLIECVRKYRILFDSSHEHYKNLLKEEEAWNEISKEVNMTSGAAKSKWKNLRDSYIRFKKSVEGQTGQARKYSKWPWSSQMSFLDTTLQYRPQKSNVEVSEIQIGKESQSSQPPSPIESSNDRSNQTHSSHFPYDMPLTPTPKNKKKSNISSDSEVDKVIKYLQNKRSQEKQIDGVDHLFLSYAATFKTFSAKSQAELKLKLALLFSKTELDEIKEQNLARTTSSSSTNSSGFATHCLATFDYSEMPEDYSNTGSLFICSTAIDSEIHNFGMN